MYVSNFKKINPKLEDTIKGHLIGDLKEFGILSDDYQKFIKKRTKLIFEEIQNKVGQ